MKTKLSKIISSNLLPLIAILGFAWLGMKDLFGPGLYSAHDIWHQVARFYHYQQAISDWQIFPAWISNLANGFGYPLYIFSYHLPWILGVPMLWLGFDIPTALKMLFGLAFLASGISMYYLGLALFKNRLSALLSSLIYLWAPYHFLVTFVSASIGLAFIFALLPMVLLGIYKIGRDQKPQLGILMAVFGTAAIVLSHFMTFFFVAPLVAIFALWVISRKEGKAARSRYWITSLVLWSFFLGVLISGFYLLPAAVYNRYTKTGIDSRFEHLYENQFINFNQLIYSKWGYSAIVSNAKDGEISFQLGVAQWLAVIGVIGMLVLRRFNRHQRILAGVILSGLGVSIVGMLDLSKPLWKLVSEFITLDYPTRFMVPAVLCGSLLAGLLLTVIKGRRWQVVGLIFLVLVAVYTNRNHIRVNMYTNYPVSLYVDSEVTTNTFNEYLPYTVKSELWSKKSDVVDDKAFKVSRVSQNTRQLSFVYEASRSGDLSVRQFFFPGQTLYVDGFKTSAYYDKDGRIRFTAPAGTHEVKVIFEEPLLIMVGKMLSLLGILGLGLLMLVFRFKKL